MGGTYVLILEVAPTTTEIKVEVGALGSLEFTGTYAYIGSALGSGGFSRVDRHRRLASGESDTRHWHIDYLLGHPETTLEEVVYFHGDDRECHLAKTLPGEPVAGFGASDCDCVGHLLTTDVQRLLEAAVDCGGVVEGDGGGEHEPETGRKNHTR